nr:hypothetical protein P5658_10830 [Bacillus subtilis]
MKKITFIGAGSTIFAKNVLGDCLLTEALNGFEFALYDIDPKRLQESQLMLENLRDRYNPSVVSTAMMTENSPCKTQAMSSMRFRLEDTNRAQSSISRFLNGMGCARRSPIQ